jgi:hypothetical protein
MKRIHIPALALIAACGLLAATQPAGAAGPRLQNITIAVEAFASSITLPASANGPLAMPVCAGCAPKTFQTTAETQYLVNDRPVSIATLHAALLKHPKDIVTVSYVVKTGVVTQVSASR